MFDNHILYKIFGLTDMTSGIASAFTLAAIACERLHTSRHIIAHRSSSKWSSIYMASLTWVVGVVLALLHLILWDNWRLQTKQVFTIVVFVLTYIVPLSIIVVAYYFIYNTVVRRPKLSKKSNTNKRVTKSMAVRILAFYICWTPFMVTSCVYAFIHIEVEVIIPMKDLFYSNSVMNFVIYAFGQVEFRRALLRTFAKLCRYAGIRIQLSVECTSPV